MSNEMMIFKPSEVATFGNKLLGAIVAHEMAKETAERELQVATKRESFIDVEMVKTMMYLHGEETIDLFKVFGDNKDSAILYRSTLVALGVLARTITDKDEVEYTFTDAGLADQYHFPSSMNDPQKVGESAEDYLARINEYIRRRARRNALNTRLARCAKSAIALLDAGATVDDLVYSETETGETQVILKKGPKEVTGSKGEVTIVTGNAAKAEGASLTPTFSGLAKVADAAHKEVSTKQKTSETATRKETDGDKSGNESDFLAMVNAMIMTVKGRENAFADAERIALINLVKEIAAAGVKAVKS